MSESLGQQLGASLDSEARRVRAHLLTAMRREIEATVMPELTTAYARLAATWVCQAVDYLLLEEYPAEQWIAARDALLADLPQGQEGLPAIVKPAQPVSPQVRLPDLHDPHRSIDAIAAAVRGLASRVPPQLVGNIGAVALEGFRAENRFLEEHRVAALKSLREVEIEVTPERIDRYFDSTREFVGYRAQSITRMVGGYSRDTFIIAARTPAGAIEQFAIRRDLPFGPVAASAADELHFLERLQALGIPVARPRAAVRDRSFLGQPFLLTDRVPGVVATAPMSADRALGDSGARELAQILARLHAIDPRDVGLQVASEDPRSQIAAGIDYWRQRWRRHHCVESDIMEAAFAWLDDNVPQNVPRIVVIHGDYRPDNALMDQGRISAMLDWEFIHPGDAAEDVEYMKLFVQPFMSGDDFMKEYLAAGGVDYEPASRDFYEVFRSVRNVACVDTAWYGFLTGRYPSMRLSFQGTTARRMLLMMLAESLTKVTSGHSPRSNRSPVP
ncbi:MAG TPA: phosphotransferase family protein [Steroidobacteraceae bacterium]|nr:phosphotransferase family protein [Steroidobacteraceae bacterium]